MVARAGPYIAVDKHLYGEIQLQYCISQVVGWKLERSRKVISQLSSGLNWIQMYWAQLTLLNCKMYWDVLGYI